MRDPETGRLDEESIGEKEVTGYADRWGVQRGESVDFLVNCDGPDEYRADIVKLICGDINPDGSGFKEEVIDAPVNGTHAGQRQEIYAGSYVEVPDAGSLDLPDGFTLQTMAYPTLPERGTQGLLAKWDDTAETGYALVIEDGRLALWLGDGETVEAVRADEPLEGSVWHLVAASYDAEEGAVTLYQDALPASEHLTLDPDEPHSSTSTGSVSVRPAAADAPFTMAAYATGEGDEAPVAGYYNGKLDRPRVTDRPLDRAEIRGLVEGESGNVEGAVAVWDFAAGISPDGFTDQSRVEDAGPHQLHGEAQQLPARAVTGYNWDGSVHDFTKAPDQYAAIHFHEDDVADAGWDVSFTWDVPPDQESAVYAARLRTDDDEFYVPVFVRPQSGTATADIAFLAPTNSYLAYANAHLVLENAFFSFENHLGMVPTLADEALFLANHREYGLSQYDTHPDGHGSMFSSRLRPLLDQTAKFVWGASPPSHLHQFNADLHLIDWFEALDYEYDVITDEDLHEEGVDLLNNYNVVLTGSHPEYYSEDQFAAIQGYQQEGGRFMYLGGNGFYWVISYHPDNPQIIETRRSETGTEAWVPEPGELLHQTTGEKGGLWRKRGWSPQKLTGVGFSAQWDHQGTYYRRNEDSYEDEVSFIFEGIDDEKIGDFGLQTGGAAGEEIDRYDSALGSPEHAHVLASSEGHTEYERQVREELAVTEPFADARMNPLARADLVYYKTPNEGAVFSVGSMAWMGSLAHNDYDNNVSRLTQNVLDHFAKDNSLPGADPG